MLLLPKSNFLSSHLFFVQVVSGGEHKTKKVVLRGQRIHPSIERAVNFVKESFEQLCLRDQVILGNKESWTKVLALIPDDDLRAEIDTRIAKEKTGVDRYISRFQKFC